MNPARVKRPELYRRGFISPLIIAIVVLVIGAGGILGYFKFLPSSSNHSDPESYSRPSPLYGSEEDCERTGNKCYKECLLTNVETEACSLYEWRPLFSTSDEGDEIAKWKTVRTSVIKATLKLPPNWSVEEQEGGDVGYGNYGIVNTSITIINPSGQHLFSLTKNFFGGFGGPYKLLKERKILIDNTEANETYFDLERQTQVHITFKRNDDAYILIANWDNENKEAEKLLDNIVSTFKFLD